jgi:ferric-dicitrate binding protein FerR (iron transport regulator)
MNPLLRTFPVLLLCLFTGTANAEDALDRAIIHAESLQTQALGAVAAAERAVADAQTDLQVARGIEADARRAHDPAATTVADEAVQQAQALEHETQRNLSLARTLLAARSKTLEDLRSWTHANRRPAALLVVENGEVHRHTRSGSSVSQDFAPLRAGERIETGPDARVHLFVSGGDAEVALGGDSSYTVTQDDTAGDFSARLDAGIMRLRILVKDKLGKRFEVRTPAAVCGVRGTDYSLARAPDGDVVKVYSGVVAVSPPAAGDAEVLVKSGEQLKVPIQGAWPTPQPFTADMDVLPWSTNHAKN